MIIDSHRHLVGSGWTRGGYVMTLAKMFGNLGTGFIGPTRRRTNLFRT